MPTLEHAPGHGGAAVRHTQVPQCRSQEPRSKVFTAMTPVPLAFARAWRTSIMRVRRVWDSVGDAVACFRECFRSTCTFNWVAVRSGRALD
eukprot:3061421-Prymnesium_polylepis.1